VRAVLIVNPNATSTTAAGRDLLAHALESRVQLTVTHTDHRGHAVEIATAAVRDQIDVLIVHGGDGTVHEVVNGLLPTPGSLPTGPLPAVAVVPGGSANVFARSLGIPNDPIPATNLLIDLLGDYQRTGRWRHIGLIDCGERWAIFSAGMGLDGEVVAAVDKRRTKGRGVKASTYIRSAVPTVLASARRDPTLTLQLPGRDPIPGVHFVFVSNASPWTYSNARPVWTNPTTTYEGGLGVFATTSMKVWANLRLIRQMLSEKPRLDAKHLVRDDDVAWLRVTSNSEPIASQIDGEYLGLRDDITFRSVPEALAVVAPSSQTPL
jgi:diacylglycerol kinase family enzyme